MVDLIDINLEISLSDIPIYPINITLISEDNFKYFNVSQSNVYFPSGYHTITLENDNKTYQIQTEKYELSQYIIISGKTKGQSKLSFGILTNETNISYDKHIKNSLDITVLGSVLSPPFYIIIIATFIFIFSSGLDLSICNLKLKIKLYLYIYIFNFKKISYLINEILI